MEPRLRLKRFPPPAGIERVPLYQSDGAEPTEKQGLLSPVWLSRLSVGRAMLFIDIKYDPYYF